MEKKKFSPEEIKRYKNKLLAKRAELMGDTRELQKQGLRESAKSDGQLSALPTHIADLGTDTFEQELNISQQEKETRLISEIDLALEKIQSGEFGTCEMDDHPISNQRLDVIPWTRYCKNCQAKQET